MKISGKYKNVMVEISRILLGVVFVFSGFVKAVDPLGTVYKIQDYLTAFGFQSLNSLALPLSFAQGIIEFALGVCLLLAVYRRSTSILILLVMLFMTPLTFYLAIKNPVTDCGCFGDALIISNWETFYKNIVLLVASVIVFLWYKQMNRVFSFRSSWLAALYTYLFIIGLSVYCYRNLPILDFRPYKVGANIPELMAIPEGAPHDEYESTFIYEKEGVQKEFTLDNYPANDSTWKFVDSKSKLIKKGYQPPIHDFTITTSDGGDLTHEVLADTSYTFLLIAHKFEKASDSNVDRINEIYDFSQQFGYRFYALTASTADQITEWVENTGAEYEICTTDDITLKTIIRSNPGLMLLKKGVIINKWAHRNLPSGAMLSRPLNEAPWGQIPPNRNVQKVILCLGALFIPLALLFIFDFITYRRKENKQAVLPEEENKK